MRKQSSIKWKIIGLFASLFIIWGGFSNELVFFKTDFSLLFIVVGSLYLLWDVYALVTHNKPQKAWFRKRTVEMQEPVKPDAPTQEKVTNAGSFKEVAFMREDRDTDNVWSIHQASCKADAMAFLSSHPVDRPHFYLIVETPEGNFGRDLHGIYQE